MLPSSVPHIWQSTALLTCCSSIHAEWSPSTQTARMSTLSGTAEIAVRTEQSAAHQQHQTTSRQQRLLARIAVRKRSLDAEGTMLLRRPSRVVSAQPAGGPQGCQFRLQSQRGFS